MANEVFGINRFDEKAVVITLLVFGIAEALLGSYKNSKRTWHDYLAELVSFPQLTILIQPGVILLVGILGRQFFPDMENKFIGVAYGFQFLILLILIRHRFLEFMIIALPHQSIHFFIIQFLSVA